jgi:LmbE family N-acetylglucosaminyl deacetylase
MKRLVFSLIFLLNSVLIYSQKPAKLNSSEIYETIQKLNFFGSVLYIAAHPDDENTRLISYFSNDLKARTGYLSITRGDGGQNLIGPEIRELLGVIRTQELLAARRVDGSKQFFTRANDFGYSKHPEETLTIWNKKEVLKDVVAIIRKFKPDVIINRFDYRTPGTTHGHHTSSALLSVEAFDLVGDQTFKGHNLYKPWQPKRLFFNTTWWFYGSKEKFEKADKTKMLNFDIGVYYPKLGLSNSEIASLSRSKHRSQGFGSTGTRGQQEEYIEIIKGDLPKDKKNIFDGIDTSWNRVEGGEVIGKILTEVENEYNFNDPSRSIPKLIKAYQYITKLSDTSWKKIKIEQIQKVIEACAGLYLEVASNDPYSYPNGHETFNIEAINRSKINIKLKNIKIDPLELINNTNLQLTNNKDHLLSMNGDINENVDYTNSYWLNQSGTLGMYNIADKTLIGEPETPKKIKAKFDLDIEGYPIEIIKDVIYKYNDPVKGEVYQPYEIIPIVTTSIKDKVIIFSDNTPREIRVKIKANRGNLKGSIALNHQNSWQVTPDSINFTIDKKGEEQFVVFKVTPPNYQDEGKIEPIINIEGEKYDKELFEINYSHIPKQLVLLPSEAKIVRLNIKKEGQLIGYIPGAGDDIPTSLRQIGYAVVVLDEKDITFENLKNFDAVILGIRAYNVNVRSKFYQKELNTYTENGGTLVVQYNTSFRTKVEQVAPYELELSRDRVVDEKAEVIFLDPNNEVLNFPNKITAHDFDGWVQERGLYFPDKWSEKFTPLLSMHDKGESAKKGSLLIANYGKGHFIYTGLSFFRELPAGVPGAFKLFANILSVGKNNIDHTIKN